MAICVTSQSLSSHRLCLATSFEPASALPHQQPAERPETLGFTTRSVPTDGRVRHDAAARDVQFDNLQFLPDLSAE